MTIACTNILFALQSLLRLDILAWVIGLPLLVGIVILFVYQYRSYKALQEELKTLSSVNVHSVEYDLVMRAMKLLIWRMDVATRILTFETDYRDGVDNVDIQSGVNVQEVMGMIEPKYAQAFRDGFENLLANRVEVFHTQYQMKTPSSDHTYWAECFVTVDKRDLQGNPLSVVGTVMRIDQQKAIEKALMDAVYHAEESDRLKSAFLANISHEIRTPLNAIVGFSQVLTDVEDKEERQSLIKLIKENNAHLLQIFDDIVRMSKLEARGAEDIETSTFQLKDVFTELIEKYKPQLAERGLSIEMADEELLPELTTDRGRLREIINQYVDNAVKFTPAGKITLGFEEYGNRVRIYVRDTGIGIPEDKCNEHLFDRFVKVNEFVAGTGLGLSICRSLAMNLNGEVGFESKEGEGSVFWVELYR